MSQVDTHSWKLIGRGSEASVFVNPEQTEVVKRFDRLTRAVGRNKANREFERLTNAWELTHHLENVSVPRPISHESGSDHFRMQFSSGTSLLTYLLENQPDDDHLDRLSSQASHGLCVLNDRNDALQPDCTLDHILVESNGELTFVDFGNGSAHFEGIQGSSMKDFAAELVGSTLYECARPSRIASCGSFRIVGKLIRDVVRKMSGNWDADLDSRAIALARSRTMTDTKMRRLWYAVSLRIAYRFLFGKKKSSKPNSSISAPLKTVFMIVWDFPSAGTKLSNGIHKTVDGLCRGLSKAGIQTHVLALGAPNIYRPAGASYTVQHMESTSLLLERISEKGSAGITILNSVFSPRNNLLAFQLRRRRLGYAVSPHTTFSSAQFDKSPIRKRIFWHLFERPMLQGAKCIQVMDSRDKGFLTDLGVSSRVYVMRNGIPESTLQSEVDLTWSRNGPVRFHFFGRIQTKVKGLDLMLDAAKSISRTHDIEIYLQGPDAGDLSKLKSRVVKDGLSNLVHFIAPEYDIAPVEVMARYDVFLMTSRFEGFPTSAVEAMMAGRPVVVTEAGGLASIIRENELGIVVKATSEEIEAGMRLAIARRDEWQTMGLRAHAFARSHFDWNSIAQDFFQEMKSAHHHE